MRRCDYWHRERAGQLIKNEKLPFMKPEEEKRLSKFLSLVLRHRPEHIGLTPDEAGWVRIDALIAGSRQVGIPFDRPLIEKLVAENAKQRFALHPDGEHIRASQGHSISVELGYTPLTPPEWLCHGTAIAHLPSILEKGLEKRARHHVHLSETPETALQVGQRHGKALVLWVAAGTMHQNGFVFFRSENGVWLTDHVPPAYLSEHPPGDGGKV